MWLSVELKALEMMTGFESLVLLFDTCLELGSCISLIDLASCLHFWSQLLLVSLPVVTEPMEMSCWLGWGWIVGRSKEDSGGLVLPDDWDNILGSDGGRDNMMELEAPRSNEMKGNAGAVMDELPSKGPTWSSAPSSSALILSSICVADWEDELAGLNAWISHGWVPGINTCILW